MRVAGQLDVRLLADENIPLPVVQYLRENGFEVEAIAESEPGASDAAILGRDDISELVLITFDRDFGELIFKDGHAPPKTLIYSRLGRAEPRYVADRIAALLEKPAEAGVCYVISREGERTRPFSAGSMFDA